MLHVFLHVLSDFLQALLSPHFWFFPLGAELTFDESLVVRVKRIFSEFLGVNCRIVSLFVGFESGFSFLTIDRLFHLMGGF